MFVKMPNLMLLLIPKIVTVFTIVQMEKFKGINVAHPLWPSTPKFQIVTSQTM